MNIRFGAIVLIASSVALLSANPGGSAPTIAEIVAARVARLTKLLTLTTAQATQATSLFTTEETALEMLETSEETARTALTTAVESNNGVSAAVTQLGAVATQELLAKATANAEFYAMLTPAQQAIEKELLAAGLDAPGPGPRPGRGPGHGPH
ncbi:MAG: hypothetical protein ABUS51_00560 [Acidobacteriota bacterium]